MKRMKLQERIDKLRTEIATLIVTDPTRGTHYHKVLGELRGLEDVLSGQYGEVLAGEKEQDQRQSNRQLGPKEHQES